MKKILAFVLMVLLLLTACSAPAEQTETPMDENQFMVGYSSKIVNPPASVPLVGYGNVATRYMQEMGDDIKIFLIAIHDGQGNQIMIVNTDFCTMGEALGSSIQTTVHTATGIPMERIYVSANHSHSAPQVTGELQNVPEYRELVFEQLEIAAKEAMADLKPAKMYVGSAETENLNFVKHYQYVDENGEMKYFGDNFGSAVYNETTEHTTEADTTMHVLKFEREGCKDLVICNWRAHPHFTGGSKKYVCSSDYPGTFREALEMQLGCDAVYMQGACGNINSSTRLAEERRTTDVRTFGALLAGYAIEALENNMTEITTGQIQTQQYEYYGEINHTFDALYVQAKTVSSVWASTNNWDECRPYMTPYGIRSPYHANAIVSNAGRTKEKDGKLIMNAVSIGEDFAFVTFPGELFDAISVGVEEGSPYATTMLFGYSTGHIGYLPSGYAFEYTSYETDITRFQAGTGEIVRDEYIRMLSELKEG